jgi:hypothetical protein
MNIVNEDKLSPWFPHETKPVLPGVYETKFFSEFDGSFLFQGYSKWDGKQWCDSDYSIIGALKRVPEGAVQDKSWRGVKPKHLEYQVVKDGYRGLVWDANTSSVDHAYKPEEENRSLNTFWKE